jgi:hypothetical protein
VDYIVDEWSKIEDRTQSGAQICCNVHAKILKMHQSTDNDAINAVLKTAHQCCIMHALGFSFKMKAIKLCWTSQNLHDSSGAKFSQIDIERITRDWKLDFFGKKQHLAEFMRILLSVRASEAVAERVFFHAALRKTSLRNRYGSDTLDLELFVRVNSKNKRRVRQVIEQNAKWSDIFCSHNLRGKTDSNEMHSRLDRRNGSWRNTETHFVRWFNFLKDTGNSSQIVGGDVELAFLCSVANAQIHSLMMKPVFARSATKKKLLHAVFARSAWSAPIISFERSSHALE